ncbi:MULTISPECIES: dihydrodipicolinate reductase C-terminal domain-containing protein [unclassified Agarivorans]|uniref:dihydrodipicolinate reductase C-terminal domain-containing protein n=1 Tax=unclassified Agarivorans TaxID=2636026 RepID=UPI003D7DE9A7
MNVFVVGNGKLANELLSQLQFNQVKAWHERANNNPAIIVHAGSGRELEEIMTYCRNTNSVLVELSTGSQIEEIAIDFSAVVCPNINILMLKFMHMISNHGQQFQQYNIQLSESHQSEKTSVPGTAVYLANAFDLPVEDIHSIRNPEQQQHLCGVPSEHLSRHAVHQITIQDSSCSISLESRVYGDSPYASGVLKVIHAIENHQLEQRLYTIHELIEKEWL